MNPLNSPVGTLTRTRPCMRSQTGTAIASVRSNGAANVHQLLQARSTIPLQKKIADEGVQETSDLDSAVSPEDAAEDEELEETAESAEPDVDAHAVRNELRDDLLTRKNSLRGQKDPFAAYLADILEDRLLTPREQRTMLEEIEVRRTRYRRSVTALPSIQKKLEELFAEINAPHFDQLGMFRNRSTKADSVRVFTAIKSILPKLRSVIHERDDIVQKIIAGRQTNDAGAKHALDILSASAVDLLEQVPVQDAWLHKRFVDLQHTVADLSQSGASDEVFLRTIGQESAVAKECIEHVASHYGALKEIHDEFIHHNLALAIWVAKKFRGRGLTFLDCIQEGNIGLLRALDKFDLARNTTFSTYAIHWVKQAIGRAIQNQSRTIRLPCHVEPIRIDAVQYRERFIKEHGRYPTSEELQQKLGISLEMIKRIQLSGGFCTELIPEAHGNRPSDSVSPLDSAAQTEVRALLMRMLRYLPTREREILRVYMGLGKTAGANDSEYGLEHTLDESVPIFHVTRERVRQLMEQSIHFLQNPHHPMHALLHRISAEFFSDGFKEPIVNGHDRERAEGSLATPLAELGLETRLLNILADEELFTIGDLEDVTDEDLLQIRNFGKKMLMELKRLLRKWLESSSLNHDEIIFMIPLAGKKKRACH